MQIVIVVAALRLEKEQLHRQQRGMWVCFMLDASKVARWTVRPKPTSVLYRATLSQRLALHTTADDVRTQKAHCRVEQVHAMNVITYANSNLQHTCVTLLV
jgi:hypothetical protein